MIYVPEKEEIVREKKWITQYSRLFFKHQRGNGDKLMVFGSAMSNHGFIVNSTGELFGFGWNDDFQLGVGDNKNRTTLVPIKFFSGKRIKKICCGGCFSIFFLSNNQLYSTGYNKFGQLGVNDFKLKKSPKLADIKGFDVLDVFVGYCHTVVISKFLQVYSFGKNEEGQLGVGDKKHREIATKVLLLEKIISVSCGGFYSFFISVEGNLYLSGSNEYKFTCQFGGKSQSKVVKEYLEIPKKILFEGGMFEKKLLQIECGVVFNLFLTSDQKVFVTGENKYGQLGTGDTIERTSPCLVSTLKNEKIVTVKCGAHHSLFKSKEKIWITGWNEFGQLGNGNFKNGLFPKLFFIEGKKIVQSLMLLGSSNHFTKSNEVYGSGYNSEGQLFCGENIEKNPVTFKLCSLKVKEYEKNKQRLKRLKEMWERFELLLISFGKEKRTLHL